MNVTSLPNLGDGAKEKGLENGDVNIGSAVVAV